ncbi:MAG TPA: methylenetetrahydrofolate reductase C-terminal domain-containing protein [Bacteroidales bacterium]|nr:methylenetetrahydrofolate reductase C-terminal domain-containing protein [Bacteroidales bacterium]
MLPFKPVRRWQPPFYPFKREKWKGRLLTAVERVIKGPLFGCRMCGNCILQKTSMVCHMQCPKGLRNGPCGGITPEDRCYIDNTRICVWNEIYSRSVKSGTQENLLEVLPPLDWNKTGTSTWKDVLQQAKKAGRSKILVAIAAGKKSKRKETLDDFFKTIRQPSWWQGDSLYHPPSIHNAVSDLEKILAARKFVVTAEISAPVGTSTGKLIDDINAVKPYVTAINFTDSPSAKPKMSSLASCTVALSQYCEPVLQIAARDITRTGLQSSVMGLNQFGIRNILCITGDNPIIGSSPIASMNVTDVDSAQMLWILRRMRDDGICLDGKIMSTPPSFFLGASTSPLSMIPELQAIKDQKKINAGAQFLQTNLIFEPEKLDEWLEQLYKRNVLDKVFIIAGISPLKSLRVAEFLRSKIPGVKLPVRVLERLNKAGESAHKEGLQIALETIESLKGKQGICGIHIMTLGWATSVETLVSMSGLKNSM